MRTTKGSTSVTCPSTTDRSDGTHSRNRNIARIENPTTTPGNTIGRTTAPISAGLVTNARRFTANAVGIPIASPIATTRPATLRLVPNAPRMGLVGEDLPVQSKVHPVIGSEAIGS